MDFSERCRQAKILKIANFKALTDVAREEIGGKTPDPPHPRDKHRLNFA